MNTVENLRIKDKLLDVLKKAVPITLAVSLSLGVVGCSSSKENTSGAASYETSTESEDTQSSVAETTEETNMVVDAYEKSMDADTAVEQSITGTMELAKSVSEATDEYRATEEYQQNVEALKTEFDTLINWLLGKTEIDGYTIQDVGNGTIDLAKDAVYYVDGVIESYIPDYKDKAKEKLSELGNFLWDKTTDLGASALDKGQEWIDEVKEKSKSL